MVSARQFIKWSAVALGVVAVVALMLPVSAAELGPFGVEIPVDCGSTLSSTMVACSDAVDSRRAWAVPLLVVALVAFLAATLVRPSSDGVDAGAAPAVD